MPSLMPFTPGDFEVAEAEAARLLPALKGRMRPADPERSINGMFSFTPDAGSIVGESSAVRGVWICEAVWVTHAGGFGKHVAEWMVRGEPSIDMAEADANRFYPYMTTPPSCSNAGSSSIARSTTSSIRASRWRARASLPRRSTTAMWISAPSSSWARLGTSRVFEANASLIPSDAPWLRRAWAAPFWSPIEGAEHLATRSSAALFDLTAFAKFDVEVPTRST